MPPAPLIEDDHVIVIRHYEPLEHYAPGRYLTCPATRIEVAEGWDIAQYVVPTSWLSPID